MKLSTPIISRVQLRRNIKNDPQFLRTLNEQYLILYDTDPTRGSVFVDVTYSKKDTTFSNIDVRAWPTTLIWHLWSYWLPLTTSFKISSYIMRTRKRVDQYQNPILSHFGAWESDLGSEWTEKLDSIHLCHVSKCLMRVRSTLVRASCFISTM